jgi:hypothetical protein
VPNSPKTSSQKHLIKTQASTKQVHRRGSNQTCRITSEGKMLPTPYRDKRNICDLC